MNPANTKMELNVRTIRSFFSSFENIYGKKELMKLIEGTDIPLDYFSNENNWISFNYFNKILKLLVDYTGDPEIPYKFGLLTATRSNWGVIATILTAFISCTYAYKTVIAISPRWTKVGKFRFLRLKKNSAAIELRLVNEIKQNRYNCLSIQGSLAAIPTVFNLPPAKIHELQCAAEGADSCIYELTWKNPPSKKNGLYLLLTGLFISALIYASGISEKSIIPLLSWSPLLIFIIALIFINKIINSKETLKENSKQIEKQNKTLEDNLLEIERLNEILQKKVEERTEELTLSNKGLEQNIKDLKDNEEEMLQTGKMTLVGHVSVDIAGKLKKPVDKIHENLIRVINKTAESDPFYTNITGAQRANGRCDKIVKDLLLFSKDKANLFLQEVDINKTLNEAIASAAEIIAHPRITLEKELQDNLPKTFADYLQMKQVFMIIIMNAYDAINDAITKDAEQEGRILIRTSVISNEILVEISDTGTGIPKDVIGRIFEPFFSTKPPGKKKGIGLTIGYNAIRHLGGRIDVESEENKGTRFSIYIPVKNY